MDDGDIWVEPIGESVAPIGLAGSVRLPASADAHRAYWLAVRDALAGDGTPDAVDSGVVAFEVKWPAIDLRELVVAIQWGPLDDRHTERWHV